MTQEDEEVEAVEKGVGGGKTDEVVKAEERLVVEARVSEGSSARVEEDSLVEEGEEEGDVEFGTVKRGGRRR